MINVSVVGISQLDFVAAQFVVMQVGITFTRIARLVGVIDKGVYDMYPFLIGMGIIPALCIWRIL